jgi:hypothetical protein
MVDQRLREMTRYRAGRQELFRPMRAFHVYSLRPGATWYGRDQQPGRCSFVDFELLALILSALCWRSHNGSLRLYTDDACAEYFAARRLDSLWDDGIDTNALATTRLQTNFTTFWAYARTIALACERAPCVMLDLDMIVWKPIASLVRSDFMAIHSEPLSFGVYVPASQLATPEGYRWEDWDGTVLPCNAALMYFGDDEARRRCADQGLRFMHGNFAEDRGSLPVHAVFVEQRLYPMCVRKCGVRAHYFLRDHVSETLADGTRNDTFTHLWLYKRRLVRDHAARRQLCVRMIQRIAREFPEFTHTLYRLPEVDMALREHALRG